MVFKSVRHALLQLLFSLKNLFPPFQHLLKYKKLYDVLEISNTFHTNVDQIPRLINFQKIPETGTKLHDFSGSA